MKKSQVLAAIALAFALGVVAPIAGPVSTASAITITEGGVVTANRQDVIDTVKAIEGQTEYQQYKALYDALNLQVNNNAVTDLTAVDNTITATSIKNLSNAADYAYASYKLLSEDGHTYAEIMEDAADTAKAAIAAASGKAYNLWNDLYVAMNNNDTKNNSQDELAGAIVSAAQALGMTVAYDAATDDLSDVKTEVNGTSYATYKSLIGKINDTEAALTANTAKINALKSALAPFANTTAINDAVAFNASTGSASGYTPIANLTSLQSHATRYSNYAILIGTVNNVNNLLKTATNFTKDDTTNNPLSTVNTLKSEYKAAAGTDLVISDTPVDPSDPTVTVRTLTSENGEVTVTGAFEEGVTLQVEPTTTDVFGKKAYEAYNITLMKDGKAYNFNGNAAVTIKVSKVDAAKSKVYYVDADNKAVALTSTYAGSYISFNTTHFSLYAVVEDAEGDGTNPGNTGVVSNTNGTASSTVAVVAGIATALTAAGAGVVAYRNARREA